MQLIRKMNILFLVVYTFSFNVLFCSIGIADITKLSPEVRNKLQPVSCFQQINHVANLPASVVKLFANNKGGLADPGQEWQVTDVVFKELPSRRLIWAVACGHFYVIHYELGGRGHSYHIILGTTKDNGGAEILWHGVGESFRNFEAFLDAIKNTKADQLDDRLDYSM